jgi:hypothetical protein
VFDPDPAVTVACFPLAVDMFAIFSFDLYRSVLVYTKTGETNTEKLHVSLAIERVPVLVGSGK